MSEIVKVQVVADTTSAKQNLQELQQQLQQISSTPINVNDASLVDANKAALELQQTLQKALNPNTGKLDLSVFSRELSKSGQTLQQYQARLASIGPTGQQAFLSLSKAIATAEAPTNRISAKLLKFGQTIKNTINWQISSTMIHTIIGQFQSAINYAEKLNTSLTNIRIVTGASTNQMADFAKEANEAAKRLSTTTTAYTNASLIFFQQGLKGKDVTDRADVVIKMANVTGESAEEVSSQMTAIWNNFADGSQSLEHYADVITALGAATASSSKEIATGLEKFAAIANTVGLGYENATAALATITATTRQSAETVGTGLRTIFSRLSSLSLGETLEDGTTLTKYTKALDTVGVKVLDASGKMRDMNDIIADLGKSWGVLTRNQQIALAQTVGGVRQYTNIMALMEHYSEYEKNLEIAQNSNGALQEQQERYEEGWVAASKRIRASLEDIYKSLLNDQAIIKLMDGFRGFLDIIHGVIEGLGGIKGILLMVSALVTNKFARELPMVFQSLMNNVRNFFGFSTKEMASLQNTNQQILQQSYTNGQNPVQDVQIKGLMQINAMNQKLTLARRNMTEEEIASYQTLMANTQAYYDNLKPLAQQAAQKQQEVKTDQAQLKEGYAFPLRRQQLLGKIQADREIEEARAERKAKQKEIRSSGEPKEIRQQKTNEVRAVAGRKIATLTSTSNQFEQQLKTSDGALKQLLTIKRQADDSVLQSLKLEKAELESRVQTNQARKEFLEEKKEKEKSLSKAEQKEYDQYERDARRLDELKGTEEKPGGLIGQREEELRAQAKREVEQVSSAKLLESAQKTGRVDWGLLSQRMQLEQEALGGVHAAAQKQGALKELQSNVAKQGEIWSADKLKGKDPQQLAEAKQSMMQYAQALKTSAVESGVGELFEGELDPVRQLKDKLQNASSAEEIATAYREFMEKIVDSAEPGVKSAGQELGEKLQEGVKQAAENAEGMLGSSSEATGAISSAITAGQESGQTNMKLAIPRNTPPPSSDQDPKHTLTATEGITRAASAVMMLTSAMSSARNLGKTFTSDTASGMDKLTGAMSTVASTAMTMGMMIKLAGEIASGPWGIVLGVITSIITLAAQAFSIAKGIDEQKIANEQKNAEESYQEALKTYEKRNEVRETQGEFDALYNTYKKLTKGTTEAASAQDQLIAKAKEVAEAYKDAHLYLAAVAGDIDSIEEQMENAEYADIINNQLPEAKGLEREARRNLEANLTTFTIGQTSTYGSGGVYNKTYNERAYNLAQTNQFRNRAGMSSEYTHHTVYDPDDDSEDDTGFEMTDTQLVSFENNLEGYLAAVEFLKAYEELVGDATELQNDPIYQQLSAYIREHSADYEAYIEAGNKVIDIQTRQRILESQIFKSKDLEEYIQKRKDLIKTLADERGYLDSSGNVLAEHQREYDDLVKEIDLTLSTSRVGNMQSEFQVISTAAETTGYSIEEVAAVYDKFKEKYGENAGMYFAQAINKGYLSQDPSKTMLQNFEDNINIIEKEIEKTKLTLTIEVLTKLKDLEGKDVKNTEDYFALFKDMSQEGYASLGKAMGLSGNANDYDITTPEGKTHRAALFHQYMAGSTSQRNIWLTQGQITTRQQQAANLPGQIAAKQEDANRLQGILDANALNNNNFTQEEIAYLVARYRRDKYLKSTGKTSRDELSSEQQQEYDALQAAVDRAAGQTSDNAFHAGNLYQNGIAGYDQVEEYLNTTEALTGVKNEIKDLGLQQELYAANGFRDTLMLEAAAWEVNYNDVIDYAAALRESGVFDQSMLQESEEYALAILIQQQNLEKLRDSYKGWLETLRDETIPENSPLKTKAWAELEKTLKGILGLSENEEISDMLKQWALEGDHLQQILEGNKKAWAEMIKTQNMSKYEKAWKKAGQTAEDAGEKMEDLAERGASYELGDVISEEDVAAAEEYVRTLDGFNGPNIDTEAYEQAVADMLGADRSIVWTMDLQTTEDGITPEQQLEATLAKMQAEADANNTTYSVDVTVPNVEVKDGEPVTQTITVTPGGNITLGDYNLDMSGGATLSFSGNVPKFITEDGSGASKKTQYTAKTPGGGGAPKGGGGGGKQKKKDHKKPDIGTRYHKIKEKQQNNDQEKQEINRKKERAFGAEKIKQAEKEIELQKEAIELQRQYIDEITDYLAGDRLKMLEAFTPDKLGFDLGFNIQIDENGVITNYRQLEEKLLEEENKLIDRYNSGGLDDEAYNEAQKKIDEAREYLKIYEETQNLYEEQWIKLAEYLDNLADSALELTKLKIELDISISDDALELLDYFLEKIEDDAYKTAEAISLLGDKTGETLNRIDIYREGLEEILNNKGFSLEDLMNLSDEDLINADFTEAEISQIREWRTELLNANKELLEMREQIIDKILDAFDKLNEKVSKSYEEFDNYNSVLESYKNITDLLGMRLNQQQQELIQALGKATLNNAQQQAAAARAIYETALANREAAQRAYDEAVAIGDTAAMDQWQRVIDQTQESLDEAQQQWLEAWENALTKAQELYTAAIENVVKKFEESVSGAFGTLDYLQSAFDRMGQTNDQYLQDFEKLYELSKLNRDIQNAIDDTNNIRDKQALKKLQQEINQLQKEGVELSQYDVDALRKKFELEQARQALEDARNAKSEVRLQRDANGNWGYVYTAQEDEVAKAEQEYEDKLYEYQKLNDDYIKELQSRVLEAQTTYKDALAEIYNDTTLTDEQRQARIDELNNWLTAELSYFEQQLQNAMANQEGTLELYYKLYNNSQAELADTWEETTLRMLSGAGSVSEYMDNVRQAVEDMLRGSAEALSEYNDEIDRTDNMAGINTEDFINEVGNAIDEIGDKSEEAKNKVSDLSQELSDEFIKSLQAAVEWEEEYTDKINAAVEANEKFAQSINDMIAKLAELESSNPGLERARTAYKAAELEHEKYVQEHGNDAVDANWERAKAIWQAYLEQTFGIPMIQDTGTDQYIGTEAPTPEDNTKIDTKKYKATGEYEADNMYHYPIYADDKGNRIRGPRELHDENKQETMNDTILIFCSVCGRFIRSATSLKSGGYLGHLPSGIASAKTGMYTGSWGGDDVEQNGRLAFLHQKELVLNQDDTKNFLEATQILRTIDLSANAFGKGLSNIITPWIGELKSQALDQNVHIDATFPSVTDHNEIELAFDNLINKASQYANRKNMSSMTFQDMYTSKF